MNGSGAHRDRNIAENTVPAPICVDLQGQVFEIVLVKMAVFANEFLFAERHLGKDQIIQQPGIDGSVILFGRFGREGDVVNWIHGIDPGVSRILVDTRRNLHAHGLDQNLILGFSHCRPLFISVALRPFTKLDAQAGRLFRNFLKKVPLEKLYPPFGGQIRPRIQRYSSSPVGIKINFPDLIVPASHRKDGENQPSRHRYCPRVSGAAYILIAPQARAFRPCS